MASGDAGKILNELSDIKREIADIKKTVKNIEMQLRGQATLSGMRSSFDR